MRVAFTSRIIGFLLLIDLVKNTQMWIIVKKVTLSFWTSRFQHVYNDCGGFFYY